jgi:hypothetical protein
VAIFPIKTQLPVSSAFSRSSPATQRLFIVIAATLSILAAPPITEAAQTDELDTTIEYLIGHVSGSGLTFIRNARRYSAAEAAEHMRRKYEHFKDDIRTPEEFIARCATRSLLSGKPYLLVTEQGEEIPTSAWLGRALEDYRARRTQDPG